MGTTCVQVTSGVTDAGVAGIGVLVAAAGAGVFVAGIGVLVAAGVGVLVGTAAPT